MEISKKLHELAEKETLTNKCGLMVDKFVYYIDEEQGILIDEYVQDGGYYRLIFDNNVFNHAVMIGNEYANQQKGG